jgi:hypothetical protein
MDCPVDPNNPNGMQCFGFSFTMPPNFTAPDVPIVPDDKLFVPYATGDSYFAPGNVKFANGASISPNDLCKDPPQETNEARFIRASCATQTAWELPKGLLQPRNRANPLATFLVVAAPCPDLVLCEVLLPDLAQLAHVAIAQRLLLAQHVRDQRDLRVVLHRLHVHVGRE